MVARFEVSAGERFELRIDAQDRGFYAMEHPAAIGIPHAMEGRKSTVYRIKDQESGDDYALKVMKRRHRRASVAHACEALVRFRSYPGLIVTERRCLNLDVAAPTVQKWPDLEYAIIMPWIRAFSWFDILALGKRGTSLLAKSDCLALSLNTAVVFAALEQQGIAHCDLSSGNVLLDPVSFRVELVDVEELFAAGMKEPQDLPGGTPGYQLRKRTRRDAWSPLADRFSGAVILSEILGWYDPFVRRLSFGESYFIPNELQSAGSERLELLRRALHAYGGGLDKLLLQAWSSRVSSECPSLRSWRNAIEAISPRLPHEKRSTVGHIGAQFVPFWAIRAGSEPHSPRANPRRKDPPIVWEAPPTRPRNGDE
jgi:serine/threonine protein kinase